LTAAGPAPVRVVPKPWGHEVIWATTERYVGKLLHIRAGEALSLQYHEHKDETIHVLRGRMLYRVGPRDAAGAASALEEFELGEGQSYRNVPGTVHQMIAVTDCDVLEASTPHLDDVVRLEDRYGREGTSAP
jgi:mannose-6-phosphate isomerase-like protein (cupin superfamily)